MPTTTIPSDGLSSDLHQAQFSAPSNLSNYCPPCGPLTAKIALIGEAPGTQERHVKKPFVGPAGQLLDKLLLSAGLDRRELYITNTIKEQPNGNDITPFLDLSKRIPVTGPLWTHYENLLRDELAQCHSNVLVAVGAVPLYALTRRKGISKLRGSILESTLLPGRKVIPIIHPAAALREYLFTHTIRWDLRKIRAEAEFPDLRLPARDFKLNPSYSEILYFISHLHSNLHTLSGSNRYTVLDIEILNEEISCLCIGHESLGVMTIPFICEEGDCFSPEQELTIWSELSKLLEDSTIYKLGQNITFDATFIFRRYGLRTFPVLDTMVAQGIAFPDFPKGLDFLTSIYTSEPYYKDDGKKWFKLGGSFKDLWLYNAKDGIVLPEIHHKLTRELAKQSNIPSYTKQISLIEPLVYLSEHGIRCDVEGMREASAVAGEKIQSLTSELHTLCGFELNPASPKQLADYFYGKLKFKPYTNRKTGSVSTDRDALKRLARKGCREASILLEIRKTSKLKGTYLDVKLDADNRLRSAFNPVGTTSGRLSSSKTIFDTGMNEQNLPPELKRFLQFDEGMIGYNVDLSQAENRTVAYVAPDELMIRVFEEGLDMHSMTGALVSGLSYDEVKDQDSKGICCEIGGGIYTWRFWGKKANHGLNYDLGYRTFAFYYEIPEREAQFIVEKYHRAYPGVRQYHSWIRDRLSKTRTLTNCLGRSRLFLDRWAEDLFKEAYSFIPQSTIADKMNHHGVLPLYYDQQFSDVILLNQVHDSVVFQIPLSIPLPRHVEILLALRRSLEQPISFDGREFSIPADIEFALPGGNLGKATKDSEGNTVNPLGLQKLKGATKEELLANLSQKLNEVSDAPIPSLR